MPRSAICLVIDRLQAAALGAYGNTWLPTPNFDELAARSMVFDRCFADAPELAAAYQAYWYGRDAFAPRSAAPVLSLAARASAAGVQTILVTDDAEVSSMPGAADFAERIVVEHDPPTSLASDVEQTQFYRLMATALDAAASASDPFLLWIHARAMAGSWDAPAELREQFVEEDDPSPGEFFEPPSLRLAEGHDPDELLPIRFAYAGQVTLIDDCLGALLETIDDRSAAGSLLWAIASPRGFPLGEHQIVGSADQRLYNELIHVPLLVGSSDRAGALARSSELAIPADLFATLLDWFEMPSAEWPWIASLLPQLQEPAKIATRDRIAMRIAQDRALRTGGWHLRISEDRAELFAKPDDRWEVNEISDRCVDVATAMRDALGNYESVRATGNATDLPPLSPDLADEAH
jgi:arylsulfatase A-like enzyme